jgi:hypothetical protein
VSLACEESAQPFSFGWAARAVTVAAFFVMTGPAAADPLCGAASTDDTLRPIPETLVPAATRLFRLEAMPAEQVRQTTYFRCAGGRVLLCTTGANLPCGKANTGRHLQAADAWCAEHPRSDFIPAYVTGHDSIYRWRCRGGRAAPVGAAMKLDRRGFIARYWKPADAAGR